MNSFKTKMQNFGKTLLFPISLLSFMAIFLGLSAALQNTAITKFIPFMELEVIQNMLTFIRKIAVIPFTYLPLLFAMAIPMGIVKKDRGVAVYSAVVGYIALLVGMSVALDIQGLNATTTSVAYLMEQGLSQTEATLQSSLFTNQLGIFVYNTNIIGGIIAGLFGVWIHNRFRQTELHPALAFYSGKRFVPIISGLILAIFGILLVFIWPLMDKIIIALGQGIAKLDAIGVFFYGFTEKLINPTGLHHILNETFRFTAVGGVEQIGENTYIGALNIYLAQLENGLPFSPSATAFLAQGKILHMVFGLPGAVYAIYKLATPENRKKVIRYYIAGLSAVILTGITEPIEFTYIFISPVLWLANAVLAGLSFLAPALFNVTIGNIQGGIIDWIVFGMLQGATTRWFLYLILGPIYFMLYFFVYRFIITKFNIGTIGRKDNYFAETNNEAPVKTLLENDYEIGTTIVTALGGAANILDVDNCISRLRVEVRDATLINEALIKTTKPLGIVRPSKQNIQIVYGGRITKIRNLVDDCLDSLTKD